MADRDRAGVLDFLECTFLRCRGTGEQPDGRNRRDYRLQTHRNPRKIHAYPMMRRRHGAGRLRDQVLS